MHSLLKKHEIEYLLSKKPKGKGKGGKGKGKGKRNGSRSPSPGGEINGVKWTEIAGRKLPYCCMKFLKGGKCDSKEKFGKDCIFPHLDGKQYEDAKAKLAKGQ